MKRIWAILLTFTLVLTFLPAMASAEEALEPATFTWFISDMYAKDSPDDSPVMQQIYDLYGVRFDRIIPSAEPLERLNIMLATDDLPDLISFQDEYTSVQKQFIDAGKLQPLNELLETYAPDVVEKNYRYFYDRLQDDEGVVWYLPTHYNIGGEDELIAENNTVLNMRNEYFDEVGYDVWPETLEEYKALLPIVQEKYPEMAPVALALGAQGMLDDLIWIAESAYGLNGDKEMVYRDGKLTHISEVPEVKQFFKFLNDLNIEGYMDIESPVLSTEMLKQKAVAGQVWSYFGQGWEINSEVIAYEQSIGSVARMMYDHVKADASVEKITYSRQPNNLYLTGLTVTTACDNPERFFQFYAQANTEEGRLNVLGTTNWDFTGENTFENTEGYTFVIDRSVEFIEGRHPLFWTEWCGEMWDSDENWYWNFGVEMMYDFTYAFGNMPDGWIDLVGGDNDVSIWWDAEATRTNNLTGWYGDQYWQRHREMWVDTAPYAALTVDPGSDEYAYKLAVQKAVEKYLPRAIMASSDEEFETIWQQMIDECKAEGIDQYLAKCQELSDARVEAWEG